LGSPLYGSTRENSATKTVLAISSQDESSLKGHRYDLDSQLQEVATARGKGMVDRSSTTLKNLVDYGEPLECFICGLEATVSLQGFIWCYSCAAKQLSETFEHLFELAYRDTPARASSHYIH
jgi:hypothetical protein